MGQGLWAKMKGSDTAEPSGERHEPIRFAVFVLSSFEEGKLAAESMKSGCGVLINGEKLDEPTLRRVVDFLDGAAHVLGAFSRLVSEHVQLYVPAGIDIVDEVGSYYGNLTVGKRRFDG